MATNFDYLLLKKEFSAFARPSVEAEKALMISPTNCAILTRRALELAVKYVYTVDPELKLPYQDGISTLIHESTFMSILDPSLFPMLKYVIFLGNRAVHTGKIISADEAVLALRNLYSFVDWIDYCYGSSYCEKIFNEKLLIFGEPKKEDPEKLKSLYDELTAKDKRLEDLIRENETLRSQMEGIRDKNTKERVYTPDTDSETETRKKYIDASLADAGWIIGNNCTVEEKVTGMPNATGIGYVDYVLWGANHKPLAVVEAKKSAVDALAGSEQAKLYADCLQNQYNQRPLIYNTNGFDTYYLDDSLKYVRRPVWGFRTQDELQLEVDRRKILKKLDPIEIQDRITDRPYQKEAVASVCDAIMKKQRRMLIVQATGSGKTRVSVSIVDVLRKHNYVKNILFLADRKELVRQAKNTYSNLLKDLTCCNLLENKDDPENCRMIFSTYPTIMNAIDETKRKDGGRLFTPGHFDLIITDEAHRSIYKKYGEIFDYFDAMLIGMTATPKDDIDKNTYSVFNLENGVPTFAYELEQAVNEKYLVSYETKEYMTDLMKSGLHYDKLSEDEKEQFESTFQFEPDAEAGKEISGNAFNEWIMNADTIDLVLKQLMQEGLRVESGDKLGKTIIFARKKEHAKMIVDRFHYLFPELGDDFIERIDYSVKFSDHIIDKFKTSEMPQIAVSVDMLDTGIDVPEILNLVFFKRVLSYAKFWQMIGRGTRLCKDLLGQGQDKEDFRIFDFCGNFDFFRVNPHGTEGGGRTASLTEKIYVTCSRIARELQGSDGDEAAYREKLVRKLRSQVCDLNDASFYVKSHYRQVEHFRKESVWVNLDAVAMSDISNHIAPIIQPEGKDELARHFDYLMYSIELGRLEMKNVTSAVKIVVGTAEQLLQKRDLPKIEKVRPLLEKVQMEDYWENITVTEADCVREAMRDLIQYLDKIRQNIYYTDFSDKIVEAKSGDPLFTSTDLQNYRKKVEYYLKEHMDTLAVYKLRNNKKITREDMEVLENILWKELGTRSDYEKEYGDTPIGKLVRRIAGMDREALNESFSKFLSEEKLNVNQIRFVRLIIDYIAVNGNIEDNTVFMKEPFKSAGSITVLFKNNIGTAREILNVVEEIKNNSLETA